MSILRHASCRADDPFKRKAGVTLGVGSDFSLRIPPGTGVALTCIKKQEFARASLRAMFAILCALAMFVADLFKLRSRLEKLRICFSAISSTSLCGGHHLVFDCAAELGRCSYVDDPALTEP